MSCVSGDFTVQLQIGRPGGPLQCTVLPVCPRVSCGSPNIPRARHAHDLLRTSWRGCHEDATRKLSPWNLASDNNAAASRSCRHLAPTPTEHRPTGGRGTYRERLDCLALQPAVYRAAQQQTLSISILHTANLWKSLFTIKQNGSRIEHTKGKKTTKQDSENS